MSYQYLLVILCIIGIGIIFLLRQVISEISSLNFTMQTLNNQRNTQEKENLQNIEMFLNDLVLKAEENSFNIAEIKHVMDIVHDYKLPNQADREVLDQIAIDNEISDGINKAKDRNVRT